MLLCSWNVNGIRAIAKKGFFESVRQISPDVLMLQETKAQNDQAMDVLRHLDGYHICCNSAERKGYSGTAVLSREKPLGISNDIGRAEHDMEGRVIAVEFPGFYVVDVYVPNSGSELARLSYRKTWDAAFLEYLRQLEKKKPVIAGGDLNVAHRPIDLARPKENYNRSAGFTQTEIDGIDNFIKAGFTDTFRSLYPDTVVYSFWNQRFGARARNVGWRIDYFLVSKALKGRILDAGIHNEYQGSDHCPVTLTI